mmetsp:Transcript_25835/g.75717  ORF Transcript_25835/g.75717 Transcript_25835/m.75717 type:complete len:163 (-) Transcript_25835:377-865(-)
MMRSMLIGHVLIACLVCTAVATSPTLPSLDTAEEYIDYAADSLWSKEVGGKALVGASIGAVVGLVAQKVAQVINTIALGLVGLLALKLFTGFNPDTFGTDSLQDTAAALHRQAAKVFDTNGDGRLDSSDGKSLWARAMPFIKRQVPFVIGFTIGLSITSSNT